jgi:hypothetical protein
LLASVQAFYLKHLLFMTQTKLTTAFQKDQRENLVVAAIADILINAASEAANNRLIIVVPGPS